MDSGTTGEDYGSDVIARAQYYLQYMKDESSTVTTEAFAAFAAFSKTVEEAIKKLKTDLNIS